MKRIPPFAAALVLVSLLSGCSALTPEPTERPNLYSLADARESAAQPRPVARSASTGAGTALVVASPHAAGGFDSRRMIYLRQADKVEYFAHNEWVDTPARMLAPLIAAAVEKSGAFRAVVSMPSPGTGELKLDTEIVRLQQEFFSVPSKVRFTLRAHLVESATRKVLASREFEAVVPSDSENPQGGVVAAGKAVQTVLAELSAFCASAAKLK